MENQTQIFGIRAINRSN